MLTKEQIKKIVDLILKHTTWLTWRLVGNRYVTKEDLDRLKSSGLLPMDIQLDTIKYAATLGKLEAVLKEAEFKNLSWDQIVEESKRTQNDIHRLNVQSAELSAATVLRNFGQTLQESLLNSIVQHTDKTVQESAIRGILADKIKMGVEWNRMYTEVADDLKTEIGDKKRSWRRVATTEMHAARQRGKVAAILDKVEIYKYGEGEDSLVTIKPDPDACQDCRRLYIDEKTGHPKIFTLKEIMANAGTNYIKPWRKNAKPVLPPLHSNCGCDIRYVPQGFGWNERGELTVIDEDAYARSVQKGLDALRASDNGSQKLLLDSEALVYKPSEEEIEAIKDPQEALNLADHMNSMAQLHTHDYQAYNHYKELSNLAVYQAFFLKNGGQAQEEDDEALS